ncbi:MAG: PLP-dependent aminotransferase family protein [Planctomycetes bacterium]|nr:PLP-dependent aminotransferase family protein [Planctomycetota bacterium]
MAWAIPELHRDTAQPLAAQIAGFYAEAIRSGRLPLGERLPPIRAVAEGAGVARGIVQAAYLALAEQGLVEATVGRGTVVVHSSGASPAQPLSAYAEAALRRLEEMPGAPPLPPGRPLVANFAELAPDAGSFPVGEWRAAMDALLAARGAAVLGYGHEANGLPELRALLAERWRSHDPAVTADDLLVTAGAQQALDLALRTFCAPGDTVVTTAPSYHQMFGLLQAHGLQVVTVPFTAAGLDLERLAAALARPSVRLLYLMPTFHNPTGRTLDLPQRRALVEVLAQSRVPVVEDEYQHSLRCRGTPLPTLRSLDPRGLTLTVATVSKELFPALRLGWLVGGADLLRPMAAVKRFMDLETSPLLQAALVEFVRAGALDRHLQRLRTELAARHQALQDAARAELPAGCTITDPDGGFVAWLELPLPGQGDRLAELAAERGVRVVPGRVFDLHGQPARGVRLSLTRADTTSIAAGMAVLGRVARDLLQSPRAAQSFL